MLAASLEVRVAIFYATLINIVAVVPVMLVGGLTGAFFEPLALAYGLAVLASMLVALTVTPALGLILLGGARAGAGRPAADAGAQARLRAGRCGWCCALPWLAFAAVAASRSPRRSWSTRGSARTCSPTSRSPTSWSHFVTKPDTSLPDMDREVAQLQRELLAIPGVADVGSHIGTAPLGEEINGVNFSESWLSLSPGADYPKVLDAGPGGRGRPSRRLQRRPDLPARADRRGAHRRHHRRHRGPRLRLGREPARRSWATSSPRSLARVPGLTDVHPAALEFIPQVDVQVNLAAARRYGLTPGSIRRAAAIMMASEPMSEISSGGVLTTVAAWSTPGTRQNLASLRQLQIDTPSGGHVALGDGGRRSPCGRPRARSCGKTAQRYTEVDANLDGRALGSVTSAVKAALAQFRFPRRLPLRAAGRGRPSAPPRSGGC